MFPQLIDRRVYNELLWNLHVPGSDSEGSARGSLRLPGGGGEEEEGGGGLAGQDGGLEGQDAPRLLPPPRVPGQGAEGGQKEEKK